MSSAVATSDLVDGVKVVRDLREALYLLQDDKEIAVDLETSGLLPHADTIAVCSMYGDDSNCLGVIHLRGSMPDELKSFLENPAYRFSYHNGVGFDVPFLMGAGVDADTPRLYDTLVGGTVLAPNSRRDYSVSLRAEVERRLGVTLAKDADHTSWMNPSLTDQQVRYCAEDIVHIHGLRRAQEAKALETQQQNALQLESEIIGAVSRMTYNGLPVSLDEMQAYVHEMAHREEELGGELQGRLSAPINFGSHVQVKKALASLGMIVPTTEADFLEQVVANGPAGLLEGATYTHKAMKGIRVGFTKSIELLGPGAKGLDADTLIMLAREDQEQAEKSIDFLSKLVELRKAIKAQSSFGEKFQTKHVHHLTVHSRFWQCGTDTGRFSSTDPNLQQVTKDARRMYGHKPGWSIVAADYSQIEVVVAAYLAGDKDLLALIAKGGDIHRSVAAQIFRVSEEAVTTIQRKIAKACSFTLLFGGGAQRLVDQARRDGANINLLEGKEIVKLFFNRFKGVRQEREMAYEMSNSGKRLISVRLVSGLQRNLVGDKIRPTTILNTRVQGAAAAGMKNSIRLAHQRGLSKYFGATVHDELVGCVPTEWAQDYADELEKTMIEGMQRYIKAPIRVGVHIGEYWA